MTATGQGSQTDPDNHGQAVSNQGAKGSSIIKDALSTVNTGTLKHRLKKKILKEKAHNLI